LRTVFDLVEKRDRLKVLEKKIQDPGLWENKEKAVKLTTEFNRLKEDVESFDEMELELEHLDEEKNIISLENKLKQKEILILLSGKYDKGGAVLSIRSGAGGHDAQDWAAMLMQMYEKYCQLRGFKFNVLNQSFGDGVGPESRIGIKSASIEIKGKYAYGFLKNENGVHRLVRISPFSTKDLRHTSFALVEVLPQISELDIESIKIEPEDLKIETYRASGPGGQYVNKRETAVRITHLPSGIVASCQSERSQAQNKKRATDLLKTRLYQLYKDNRQEEISEIKGKKIKVAWGNQIRSYVLHPYKLVKDLRTNVETAQTEKVLDGNIEQFITAEIKLKSD
jgi:peptide chain release factor 2